MSRGWSIDVYKRQSVPIPSMAAPASETAEIHFQPELKTRYTRPAQMSVNGEPLAEALPIGNGYMGAMVYGGVDSDRILINEKTVWSGGPGSDENYNGGMPRGKTTEENLANLETARDVYKRQINLTPQHIIEDFILPQGKFPVIVGVILNKIQHHFRDGDDGTEVLVIDKMCIRDRDATMLSGPHVV